MGDYAHCATVSGSPAGLFRVLADVRHLPSCLRRLTTAAPAHDHMVHVSARIR